MAGPPASRLRLPQALRLSIHESRPIPYLCVARQRCGYSPGKERTQLLSKFVPDLCQKIADLGVLADLVRRKNSKLCRIKGGRGTDSVPGHQTLTLPVSNSYLCSCTSLRGVKAI